MSLSEKVGITGGAGLIGNALRKKMTTPVVLVMRSLPETSLASHEECIVGSFANPEVINKFIQNLQVLVHAASSIGPRSEFTDQSIRDDLVGTIDLAKAFFKHNPEGHFVYLSTAGGLYDLRDYQKKTEESEVDPTTLYGAVKLIIESALEFVCPPKGMVTVLRPSAVYGDSFRKNQENGLIDKLLKSTLEEFKNNPVPIFDKMESARDYLHVEDLVEAIKMVMTRTTGQSYELYNVGTGRESSIEEVIQLINSLDDSKVSVQYLSTPNERTSLIVSADKLFAHTGWIAKVSLRDGVLKMRQPKI